MSNEGVKPVGIALVVCDNVYEEPGGKRALVGLFNRIYASTFPARHPRMVVYVAVTSVRPKMSCRLDIVHGETDEPIATLHGMAGDEINPIQIFDMVFMLNNLIFPEAGTYYIRFFGNDQVIIQRPFIVLDPSQESSQ